MLRIAWRYFQPQRFGWLELVVVDLLRDPITTKATSLSLAATAGAIEPPYTVVGPSR
jgi:hypothetical protein